MHIDQRASVVVVEMLWLILVAVKRHRITGIGDELRSLP